MKVLIDVFGCDNPDNIISGIVETINTISEVTIVAVGDTAYIEERLKFVEFDRSRLEILHADQVITNDDKPVEAVRKKQNSSLVVAYNTLKNDSEIPIMITAGNTGAVIAGAVLILGRESRDDRPTLATLLPNDKGGVTCIADCGANVDCRPEYLLQFARYASAYVKRVCGVDKPKVGLLSVGTEDGKGNAQVKQAFVLLKQSELNFCGNMEAKTALSGDYDVVVSDGFSGNVLLKSIEGISRTIFRKITRYIDSENKGEEGERTKKMLLEVAKTMDFNSLGAAILLGAKKPVLKAHGSANVQTVVNTVKQAIKMVENGFKPLRIKGEN